MPRNGSGVATLPSNSFNPAVSGQEATPADWNETASDIESMFTSSLASNGVTTPTANLPMGGYRHTGVGDAAARNQYGVVGEIQDGDYVYAAASGASAYTVTISPAITSLVTGMQFRVKIGTTNPITTPTLQVNSTTAKTIVNQSGGALLIGQLAANAFYDFVYDGTNYRVSSTFVSPLTTRGDIMTRSSAALSRLAIGSANTVLRSDGTDPAWGKIVFADIDADFIDDASIATLSSGAYVPFADPADSGDTKRGAVWSGTYSPTLVGVTNIGTITSHPSQYIRVGGVVYVSGYADVDPTADLSDTVWDIPLPIASNLGAVEHLAGSAAANAINEAWGIFANTTDDRARVQAICQSDASHTVFYQFSYRII